MQTTDLKRSRLFLVILATAALGLPIAVGAAAVIPKGTTTIDLGVGAEDKVAVPYKSGGVLLLGKFQVGGQSAGVLRLGAGGGLLTSFGLDGGSPYSFWAAAATRDGKIVGAVEWPHETDPEAPALVRLLPDGSRDPSFRVGRAPLEVGHVHVIANAPDGDILVGGLRWSEAEVPESVITRLLPNGNPDRTFARGKVVKLVHDFSETMDIGFGPRGRIIVFMGRGYVVKLGPSGGVEPFGESEWVDPDKLDLQPMLSSFNAGNSMEVMPDGGVLISGVGILANPPPGAPEFSRAAVIRLRANGTLDRGFGRGGVAMAPFPSWNWLAKPEGLVAGGNGRFFLASTELGFDHRGAAVTAFTPAGKVDHSFGQDGTLPLGGERWSKLDGFFLQPRPRRLVAVGTSTPSSGEYPFVYRKQIVLGPRSPR